MILSANPLAQYKSYEKDINKAVLNVLKKGSYILGDEVVKFEKEFSKYIGSNYSIGVGSGTAAIFIALKALNVGPSDEVITVSHTAAATIAAIEMTGAKPILIDIEPEYFTIEPEQILSAITKNTKVIIPVHIYGQASNIEKIMTIAKGHNIYVIEDCAQSHGATFNGNKLGTFGDLSCFSFYPTKNLGAIGDGGMIVSDNIELMHKVKLLREYGWGKHFVSEIPGWNSRLDEIQAAILRIKLRYLDKDNKARQNIAHIYDNGLKNTEVTLPITRKNASHVYHLYVIRYKKRDKLQLWLKENKVLAGIHYPVPIHLQPAYEDRLENRCSLNITEKYCGEILSLPIYPELSKNDVNTIIELIQKGISII